MWTGVRYRGERERVPTGYLTGCNVAWSGQDRALQLEVTIGALQDGWAKKGCAAARSVFPYRVLKGEDHGVARCVGSGMARSRTRCLVMLISAI